MQKPRWLVLAGALLLIVSARLQWMSAPVLFGVDDPVSRALEIGWEDNGFITGGLGLLLVIFSFFMTGRNGTLFSILGGACAILAGLEVAGCFVRIVEIDPPAGFLAATDVGIHLTLVGALVALAGTLWALLQRPLALERAT